MYIDLAIVVLAGAFKAVADTLTHHFDDSVFHKMDPKFWNPEFSWKYADFLKFTKYRLDAWHLANSGMIICFCIALAIHGHFLWWGWEFLIAGTVYNLSFNLFYNKILR